MNTPIYHRFAQRRMAQIGLPGPYWVADVAAPIAFDYRSPHATTRVPALGNPSMRPALGLFCSVALLSACASNPSVADAPGSTGHNFLLAPFATFRMNETTPNEVVRALGGQPTGSQSMSITFNFDKRYQGRKLLLLQYAYSPGGKCSPEKWADAIFINGTLQTYHVFSMLPGDFTSPDARKLAAIKPRVTSRRDVIKALGMPNYWTTGKGFRHDGTEELAYYWVPRTGIVNRVLITFDGGGVVAAPPVTNDKLNDTTTNWICRYNPPTP